MLPVEPEQAESQHGKEMLGKPDNSRVSRVVAVMSGKGGVGKSSVSALLATGLARRGVKVALLDADVTGPSIPGLFGMQCDSAALEGQVLPQTTGLGIRVMSLNLLLDREDVPEIWRGSLIAGAVKRFWTDVVWGKVDYVVIDLPPGTGDVSLTVLQSLPVDGVVIVTTPHDLSKMVVRKSLNVVRVLNVPILGMIQNMVWIQCPHCGDRIEPFGHDSATEAAAEMGLELLGILPIDPQIPEMGEKGMIEDCHTEISESLVALIQSKVPLANKCE